MMMNLPVRHIERVPELRSLARHGHAIADIDKVWLYDGVQRVEPRLAIHFKSVPVYLRRERRRDNAPDPVIILLHWQRGGTIEVEQHLGWLGVFVAEGDASIRMDFMRIQRNGCLCVRGKADQAQDR